MRTRCVVESRRAGAALSDGVRWESDGQGEFTIESVDHASRGTRVTLHLKNDEKEFAESNRIEALIRKYSDHIAFPVTLAIAGEKDEEPRVVNAATALWTRSRADISDDEYKEFYKHLSHDFSDPLRWSHNRVEGKRQYTSLLYIPARAPFDLWNREAPRGLKLYVQRVFIMDDAEQFLPIYLRFVKGVVDSSDLPLNVSRELLQQSPDLLSMRTALTKRVLDMLDKVAGKDADEYAGFWSEFGQVLKEGAVEDQGNKDKLAKLLRFATTYNGNDKQDQSLTDYVSRMKEGQEKIYYILADSYATAAASPHLEQLRKKELEVLLLTDRIDPWLADALAEFEGKPLQDVSRTQLDLPDGNGEITQNEMSKEHKSLLKKIKRALKDRIDEVKVSQRLVDSAACVVSSEHDMSPQIRRMLEASGQNIPESKPILEVNIAHPLLERMAAEADDSRFGELSKIVLDHALLAEGSQLDDPAEYVKRMNNLLLELDSSVGAS